MNSTAIDSWALALADKEVSPPIGPSRIEDVQDLHMSGGNRTHNMNNENPGAQKKASRNSPIMVYEIAHY